MLIYNEEWKIGIMWDISIVTEDIWVYGNINFIIDGEIFPKKFDNNFTLNVVFSNLKHSFKNKYYPAGSDGNELGNREVDYVKLDYGEEPNIFSLEMAELGMKTRDKCESNCLCLDMGYSGNEERLFYSEDFGETYREIRMPRNTLEDIIMQLPCLSKKIPKNKGDRYNKILNPKKIK